MDIYEQLRRDEGCDLKPYTDIVGKLTIGVGRNLTDSGISTEEADYLLTNDVARVTGMIKLTMPWTTSLDGARFGVLQSMAFNLGVAGLQAFRRMLMAMEDGDWETAANEMVNSSWYRQVGPRAQRLAQQMTTGIWQ